MFILIILAAIAYLAVGLGFAMLSLHELATGGRDRMIGRVVAWSGIVLWLPMLLLLALGAVLVSLRPARQQVPAVAVGADVAIGERRSLRRAMRQV